MKKWSSILVKNALSAELIDELKEEFPTILTFDLKIISQNIFHNESLKLLNKAISTNKQNFSKSLIENLKEEINEIKEDLKWKNTFKGKSILQINDWVENFYTEFRSYEKFENVYIGGHSENKNIIYVVGELRQESDMEILFEYIYSKNPQLKVMFNIKVKK